MPAQLVIMGYPGAGEMGTEALTAKGGKGPAGKSKGPRGDKAKPPEGESQLPPYRPFPVTTSIFVFGQHPHPVGDFASVSALLRALKTSEDFGGPSRTVFATVRDIKNLRAEDLNIGLAKLPDNLTIVVAGSDPDA